MNGFQMMRNTISSTAVKGISMASGGLLFLSGLCAFQPTLYGDEIVMKDGRVIQEEDISRVEPDGLIVMTDAGIEKVLFTELPNEIQVKYGYDPSAAARFRANVTAAAQQRQTEAHAARQQKTAELARNAEQKSFEQSAVTIKGKVLSVTNEGVLLASALIEQAVVKNVVVERSALMNTPRYEPRTVMEQSESKEPVFVYGVTGLVDGDVYAGKVHLVGTYSYTAAMGNSKMVRAFATTEAIAERKRANGGK